VISLAVFVHSIRWQRRRFVVGSIDQASQHLNVAAILLTSHVGDEIGKRVVGGWIVDGGNKSVLNRIVWNAQGAGNLRQRLHLLEMRDVFLCEDLTLREFLEV
jgi:hypothetical protein